MLVRILLCLVLCALSGCGSNARAPVEDRSGQQHQDSSYTVKRGDTLYSIAFRYGMDFRDVAAGIATVENLSWRFVRMIVHHSAPRWSKTAAPEESHHGNHQKNK